MADTKYLDRKEMESKMETGIRSASNPLLVISNQQIIDSNSAEINLRKEDAIRLLNEHPKLKEMYNLKVNSQNESDEKEFWETFLKKNFNYKTEIYGGENPVYIGWTETDEKAYEDKYFNIMQIDDDDDDEDKEKVKFNNKLRKIKGDSSVNLILNRDDETRPAGYGDFKPTMAIELGINDDAVRDDKSMKQQRKEEAENQKLLDRYNKYSERILERNANDEQAINDVDRNKFRDKEIVKDIIMRKEETRKSNLVPNKCKVLDQNEVAKNTMKIQKFSAKLNSLNQTTFDLKSCFPKTEKAMVYLEEITGKAYKTTLRVNSDDIESKIPAEVLQRQNFYQNKHDKLLELFYSKFPTTENKEDLQKVKDMKFDKIITSLGREIRTLVTKMNEHKDYKKYTSVYEPMLTTLKTALNKIKDL